jgi:iron complex outermembrane receptor protein
MVNKDSGLGVWWGGELSLTANLLDKHKLTVGSEFRDNLHQDQKNYYQDPFISVVDDHQSSKEWAVYAEDQYKIRKNLILNAGIRYDHFTYFGGTTNPRIGLVYSPFEKTTVKILYGQAFRAPNVYEARFASIVAQRELTSLTPENIKTTELVVEKYLGQHVRVAVSGFSYRLKNLINEVIDPNTGTSFFKNGGQIKSKGMEAEVEAKLSNGIQGLFSYAYQNSMDIETDQTLINSPAHMGKLNLNAPLMRNSLFTGIELQYMSKRKTLAEGYAGAFLLTNLTLLKERIAKQFSISFSVYNLLDRKYGNPAARVSLQDTLPQDGRSFRLKLTYRLPQEK